MRFRYSEWDGTEFATQDHLAFFEQYMDFLLEYGDHALDALREMELSEDHARMLDQLIKDGLLEKVGARWRLTPRAIGRMQRRALMEVFRNLHGGLRGTHETVEAGRGDERSEGTRPYTFGDPVSELEINQTLRNAIARSGRGLPVRVREEDFELHRSEARAACNVVILLDMSGSMYRMHRFFSAKKCAMALTALVRQRYPEDTIDVVGFATCARPVPEHKLPLLMPEEVTVFDPQVRMRVSIAQAQRAPQHFTNLQMGLMLARRILAKRGAENKLAFIITDGQPTAHVQGEYIYLLYPPDKTTAVATLKEALLTVQAGIRISTFALIEDYFFMDWVGFVDQLTTLTRGVAFYCHAGDLSSCVMESYLSGKKRKAYIA